MFLLAPGLYVSFSSDSMSVWFELSQAEDREGHWLLAAAIAVAVSLEEWCRQKGKGWQLREWPWVHAEGTG